MKSIIKRVLLGLLGITLLASAAIAVEYFGGQPMGLFSGSRPANLGFTNGKFSPPLWKPNCVSSTVEKDDTHYIQPLAFSGAPDAAWSKLQGIVKGSPRAIVVQDSPRYLYAEFKSAGLGFVDDVEFALDDKAGVIQVRSASRLGVRDFSVNRARIESIRAQLAK
ncbi:MAG: DUF1499 domain-containing protein [Betaproteobacteria bacterium]